MTGLNQGLGGRVRRVIRPAFALIAALFVAFVVKDMATRFSGLTLPVSWGWVALAVLPSCASLLFQYQAWWELVADWTGTPMQRLPSLRVYIDGQIARYTPGKVGLPAVRLAGASALGVSSQVMIATLLAEVLAWSACGTILGGLLMLRFVGGASNVGPLGSLPLIAQSLGYLGAVCLLGLLFLVLLPRRVWPEFVIKIVDAAGDGPLMPWRVPAWQLLHFAASAWGGLCLVVSLGGSFSDGVYLGAVLCVATVAGFLALLAPAGVGVREVVLALFAEPILGTNGAVVLGLLARAVSLGAELLLFLLLRVLTKKRSQPAV
jgi:glycosyltransferase 2 family protein